METIVAALAGEHAELDGRLAGLEAADWDRPSPCPGWTVSDVVLHLAQTDALALASVEGRFDEFLAGFADPVEGFGSAGTVDDGAGRMVELQRGEPGPVVGERWRTGAAGLRRALLACDPGRRLQWVTGQLSARTLATTRLAETWIHGGDVAVALGQAVAPTDRLWSIARLAWRTLPYAFGRAGRELRGPVAFELRAPSGDRWTFTPEGPALTVVRGDAAELCRVAARRVSVDETGLQAEGPDAAAVLDLVRTYA